MHKSYFGKTSLMHDDKELHLGYSRLLERRALEGRAACVAPEAILALVEAETGEATRLATMDHVMACPACRADFELLRSLASTRENQDRKDRAPWFRKPRALAMAASMVLMLGAGSLWWGMQERGSDPVWRGDGGEVRLISPQAESPVPPSGALVWHSLAGAFEYEVEIVDDQGNVVLSASTPDTLLIIQDPSPFDSAEGLGWWVVARTGNGGRIASALRPLEPNRR